MRLEHRSEQVASLPKFIRRFARYVLLTSGMVFFSVAIGTVGYYFFGELTWLDSFYMSCMILTGMGPTAEMTTTSAKLFSSFFSLYSGVAFLSMTAVFLAPLVHRVLHILHVDAEDED